ncbi:paf-2 [Symbiodinium natans]|uniref:1-alkyl-2-acetylglycerophosphocholine esterase n=1 Tax=Symbiodinium natans TaxID=878477 RepID=A0A812GEH5_9DINO|nr:paf-2 [Symbiodinium natans]
MGSIGFFSLVALQPDKRHVHPTCALSAYLNWQAAMGVAVQLKQVPWYKGAPQRMLYTFAHVCVCLHIYAHTDADTERDLGGVIFYIAWRPGSSTRYGTTEKRPRSCFRLGYSNKRLSAMALSVVRPRRPKTYRSTPLGCFRERLPLDGHCMQDILLQAFYPAEADAAPMRAEVEPLIRDEILKAFSAYKGIPLLALRSLIGGSKLPDRARPPASPEGGGKWPIVVFCSGLWGSCEMYTQFCRDVASLGMIVLAMEHADGSSILATSSSGEKIHYKEPPKNITREELVEFRAPQLEFRLKELMATVQAIQALSRSSPTGLPGPSLLARVLRSGDAEDLTLMGHSFGASAGLNYFKTLSDKGLPCPFRCAVLLDFWQEPLPASVLDFSVQVDVGLVVSGVWVKNPIWISGCEKVADNALQHCVAMVHVRGTSHEWVTETQLLLPCWVMRRTGLMGKGHHYRCAESTIRAVEYILEASRDSASRRVLTENLGRMDQKIVQDLTPDVWSF